MIYFGGEHLPHQNPSPTPLLHRDFAGRSAPPISELQSPTKPLHQLSCFLLTDYLVRPCCNCLELFCHSMVREPVPGGLEILFDCFHFGLVFLFQCGYVFALLLQGFMFLLQGLILLFEFPLKHLHLLQGSDSLILEFRILLLEFCGMFCFWIADPHSNRLADDTDVQHCFGTRHTILTANKQAYVRGRSRRLPRPRFLSDLTNSLKPGA